MITARCSAIIRLRRFWHAGNNPAMPQSLSVYGCRQAGIQAVYILECLQSFEIYEYDRTRVIAIYKKYATNYINACAEVYAQYCEIRGDQENAKRSREFAKANRGRFVGGGFGIGGAAKGIAMAGAANLATGALYSVGNLLGNAVSKLGADILCDRLFSSKETITFLRNALKNDFLIGTDVLEEILISCNGQAIANPFNNERLLKAKAIINRSVGSNSKKGLLITTKAIYFSPSCKCEVPIIRYDKIDGIVKSSFGQSDIIYEKRAITATAFVGLDDAVSNLLTLTVLFFKYGDINITGKITAPPSEAEVAAKTDIAQKESK